MCYQCIWALAQRHLFFIFRSFYLSLEIKKALKNQPNKHQKINLVCPNDISYIVGQWAIWMSGNIVVPLSGQHTDNALEYFINDSESSLVISSPELMHKVRQKLSKTAKKQPKFLQNVKVVCQLSESCSLKGIQDKTSVAYF